MKTLLLNDTTSEGHLGCDAVMAALRGLLKSSEIVGCITNRALEHAPDYKKLLAIEYDLVIVNAEGTISTNPPSERGKTLVALINFLINQNKKLFIVNFGPCHSIFYEKINLKGCAGILTRVDSTYRDLTELNFGNVTKGMDISFLTWMKAVGQVSIKNEDYLLITDSVDHDAASKLFEIYLNNKRSRYKNIHYFFPESGSEKKTRYALWVIKSIVYNQLPRIFLRPLWALLTVDQKKVFIHAPQIRVERQRMKFLNDVVSADAVYTGRFHVVCICIIFCKQFYIADSNTKKIIMLLEDIGIQYNKKESFEFVDAGKFRKNITEYLGERSKAVNDFFSKIS